MAALVAATVTASGCGVIKKKPESDPDQMALIGKPLPPEKARAVLGEVGNSFVYGPGLGETVVNVGTSVLFPPYALYLLGNAVLSLSGYEPVSVAGMLPEEAGKTWASTYDGMVGAPGRVAAAVAGKEYRSRDVAKARLKEILTEESGPSGQVRAFTNETVRNEKIPIENR